MYSLFILSLALASPVLCKPHNILQKRLNVVPTLSGAMVDMTSGKGGTYPRANFLCDGSILAAYSAVVDGNSVLTLTSSTDGGSSWHDIGTAATRTTASSDLGNGYPLEIPGGRILLAYRNHDTRPEAPGFSVYRITISYSDDKGKNWLFLSDAVVKPGPPPGSPPVGIWEPFLRVALDGSLQLYYSEENSAADQDSKMRTSTDGGKTWSEAVTISGQDITSRDGMLGVQSLVGGNLIAVFESLQGSQFQIDSIVSPDDGKTWGNRRTVYLPQSPETDANAPQIVDMGGTLVVSFTTNEGGAHPGKLVTSGDSGATWGNKITVFQPVAGTLGWPGLLGLDATTLLYMGDFGGAKSQKVTLT